MPLQTPSLPIQWQIFLAGQAVFILVSLIAIYVRFSVTLAEIKLRIKVQENRTLDIEKKEGKMDEKLDNILEQVGEIRVELQNKENRK